LTASVDLDFDDDDTLPAACVAVRDDGDGRHCDAGSIMANVLAARTQD
jgi:hypothetical protein